MKELPILYSTDMVQAILAGLKTMTRRLKGLDLFNENPDEWGYGNKIKTYIDNRRQFFFHNKKITKSCFIKCPYGEIGDILYVRESFVPDYFDNHKPGYKADWNITAAELINEPKWKPSIHMPKEAARIWLQIEDIRIERLREITNPDALSEGILRREDNRMIFNEAYFNYRTGKYDLGIPISSFYSLWNKINGAESFESNPYVWAITFKVLSTTGKPANI